MSRIIVLRFSAIGDVLMTLPVIAAAARQNPGVRLTLVSRTWARPLARLLPPNVTFVTADLKGEHKGITGLNRLCRRLMALHPTGVADLHDVLRSKWVRMRFRLVRIPVASIDKGRRERRRFVCADVKTRQRPVFERYADVFRRLGLTVTLDGKSLFTASPRWQQFLAGTLPTVVSAFGSDEDGGLLPAVGIAPFAAHEGKIYPREMMEEVVAALSARGDLRVFLFGAGTQERNVLEAWASRYPRVYSVAGRLKDMSEELVLISQLRVMLSMDSANMHLASLVGVRVLSLWGATHPYGGFLGYGQSEADAIHLADLDCRPCSIYGQKPCRRGDYVCLRGISPKVVVERIVAAVNEQA